MEDLPGLDVNVGEGPVSNVSGVVNGKVNVFKSCGVDLCCVRYYIVEVIEGVSVEVSASEFGIEERVENERAGGVVSAEAPWGGGSVVC